MASMLMRAVAMPAATITPAAAAAAAAPAAAVAAAAAAAAMEGTSRFPLLVFEGAQVQMRTAGTTSHVAAPSPHRAIDAPLRARGFSGLQRRRAVGSPPL